MTYTGAQIVRAALREIGVIDPIDPAHAEQEADALEVGSDMLDDWRNHHLTIRGMTRTVYSLTSGTQNYTIGSGGTFDQDYPSEIVRWGVIPDDDATDPVEHPRGRPLTSDQWALIRVKSTDGTYPTELYYDERYAAGLGTISVYPIPDNGNVDIVLYNRIPAITTLVAATSYDLPPSYHRAIRLNLALELADHYGKTASDRLERRAALALGSLKRANIIPKESQGRPEFAIGTTRRTMNIYTDS